MTYIFPERGKIDKAQFILDRSGLVLKTCKIPTASLDYKMLRFFSLSLSEAAHAYSFYTKNFQILTKFSDSMVEKIGNANFSGGEMILIGQFFAVGSPGMTCYWANYAVLTKRLDV